ncbi:hypothetical protein [Leptospira fletcheri]|uniref:hypothetical protein n=1 Tax=Leptospira fletcheri TaxID=2484981 RepID=UPI001FE5D0B6|nr:hypothetical protein [Leptospira fletcheri]
MNIKLSIVLALFLSVFLSSDLFADGCYLCALGSSDSCRDYCRFSGIDSFDTRKRCESKGCRVTGMASCPTASNSKVCSASLFRGKERFRNEEGPTLLWVGAGAVVPVAPVFAK